MNIRKSTLGTSVFFTFLALFSLIPGQIAHAASNTIFLSPSTKSVQPSNIFTVDVKGSLSGNQFGPNAVAGTLNFPKNLLKVNSVSTANTTFNWQATVTPNNSAGTITFDQKSLLPVGDGAVHMFSITFQALANGTASASFTSNTSYFYSNFAIASTRTGGTYTISTPPPPTCPAGQTGTPPNCKTPPAPTCPTGQTGTPPNCTTAPATTCPAGQTGTPPNCKPATSTPKPTQPTTPAPEPPKPEPVAEVKTEETKPDEENGFSISDASTTRSYESAILNWKTSAASKGTISYGSSLKSLDKTAEATRLPDESYEAKLTDLTPGKQYYFTISATSDTDSTKTDSYSGVFTAKGFPVVITITENKAQATNAKIKIGEQNYSTDRSGKVSLELASGSYNIDVKTQKGTQSFVLAVAKKSVPEENGAPETQKFTFDVQGTATPTSSNNNLLMLIGGLGVGGLLIGGLLFFLWRRRQEQDQQPTTVIASDNGYNAWASQQPMPAFPQDQVAQPVATANTPVDQGYVDPAMMVAGQLPEIPVDTPAEETVPQVEQQAVVDPALAQTQAPEAPETYQEQPQAPAPVESAPVAPEQAVEAPATEELPLPPAPASQVVQTASGTELEINHNAQPHNSLNIPDEEPTDMFEAPKQQ